MLACASVLGLCAPCFGLGCASVLGLCALCFMLDCAFVLGLCAPCFGLDCASVLVLVLSMFLGLVLSMLGSAWLDSEHWFRACFCA